MKKRDKRSAQVTVRVTPKESEAIKREAQGRPGLEGIFSLSNAVRGLTMLLFFTKMHRKLGIFTANPPIKFAFSSPYGPG